MAYINIMEIMYPIGSIYFSLNDISPASIFGGTWDSLNTNNRYMRLMADSSITTGGSDVLPIHNHSLSNKGFACASYTSMGSIILRRENSPIWPRNYYIAGVSDTVVASGNMNTAIPLLGFTDDGGGYLTLLHIKASMRGYEFLKSRCC